MGPAVDAEVRVEVVRPQAGAAVAAAVDLAAVDSEAAVVAVAEDVVARRVTGTR